MIAEMNERFEQGIRLFNLGKFFEAHELWEDNWKAAEGPARLFFQGIIQAAVALLHAQRGNYAGAVSVYLKSRGNLAQIPAIWMAIDLDQFRSDLTRYFEAIQGNLDGQRERPKPSRSNQIGLTLPTIQRWPSYPY